MPKRGENIRKRKDGRWEGRYRIFQDGVSNKKTKYISVYGHSYSEVKKKLMEKKQKPLDAHFQKHKRILFSELLLLWFNNNSLNLKGATQCKYRYLIERHILPILGDYPLSELSAFTINNFLNQKLTTGRLNGNGGLSSSYVRTISHIISSALTFASQEHLCLPINHIHKPIAENREVTILNIRDQQKLEDYLMNKPNGTNIGILLALNLGLRIGEVCALSWDDIDLETGLMQIRHTISRVQNNLIIDKPKTPSSLRKIPIPIKLLSTLKEIKKEQKSTFVISDHANFVSPRTFDYRYHRTLEKCDVAPINFHSLRHTFATRCIEAGVDIKTLSEILGHANVSITLNTYVHSSLELKRLQIEKVSSYFCEQNPKVVKNVV